MSEQKCLAILEKCPLFADVKKIVERSAKIREQHLFLLTYQIGDPIICTVDESELQSRKTYLTQKQPTLQFVLPSQEYPQVESVDNNRIFPIGSHSLGLESNPLFIVSKGQVEIYQWVPTGRNDAYVSVPLITIHSGEAFGEFEIDISQKEPSWLEYAADATAGWRTAFCWPSLPKEQISYKLLTGINYRDEDRELADVGLFLHRSIRHLSKKNTYKQGATEIIVVPRPVLDILINESSAFLRGLYAFMWDHLKVEYQRSYVRSLARMHAYRGQEEIKKHFVKYVLQPCCEGRLPILVSSTEFSILESWYTAFNNTVKESMKKRRVLKPPYFFFVPDMKINTSGNLKSCNTEDPIPILSRSMVRYYTSDLVLAGSGRTLEMEMFATKPKKEASKTKGKGKREIKSSSYKYIEPLQKTLQDRQKKLKSLDYSKKDLPKNFWDTEPQASMVKPELVRIRLEDLFPSDST